jgi:hypothetical protein
MILAPTLSLNTPARGYDADATAFAAASGATDVAALSTFVKGVKELGLWSSMVCWPLRSTQNAGAADTVYSLGGLGTYNGTRVNHPAWGADGLTVDASDERVTTGFNYTTGLVSLLAVLKPDSAASSDARFVSNDEPATSNGIAFDGFAADQYRRLAFVVSGVGTRTANTRTFFGHGAGTDNTFWFQDGARTAEANAAYNASTNTLCPIGATGTGTALGQYSFTVAFDGLATTSDMLSAFYTLYKTTLGTGLGLP